MNNPIQLQLFPIPEQNSIESCSNCLCCMNKVMSEFAFCFELNKPTELNNHCSNWERERN